GQVRPDSRPGAEVGRVSAGAGGFPSNRAPRSTRRRSSPTTKPGALSSCSPGPPAHSDTSVAAVPETQHEACHASPYLRVGDAESIDQQRAHPGGQRVVVDLVLSLT